MKVVTCGSLRRKFFSQGTEAGKPSNCLLANDDNRRDTYCALSISVPQREFVDIVEDLPRFEDLPITFLAWTELGQPTEFIVECFDIDDKVYIDTSGYDYPRYKAAVLS